jgi:cation diffusion facilitator family transporter
VSSARGSLTRFAWLSIVAATLIICLKAVAYWVTGSVGLLSDALESVINLVAAIVALIVLTVAARPADEDHPYGHDKAEYFSSGVEGGMILLTAVGIIAAAIERILNPRPLENLGIGVSISIVASVINFGVARVLMQAGKQHDSITLEADAHHLMTDVWTSIGVVIGIGAIAATGWELLDPIVGVLVAANITWTGIHLVRRSVLGLMDTALPEGELDIIRQALHAHSAHGIHYHALRTRRAGPRRFISMHLLVPGAWTVQRGHDLVEHIEADIHAHLPNTTITVHVEPLEDPRSWSDAVLDPVRSKADKRMA